MKLTFGESAAAPPPAVCIPEKLELDPSNPRTAARTDYAAGVLSEVVYENDPAKKR